MSRNYDWTGKKKLVLPLFSAKVLIIKIAISLLIFILPLHCPCYLCINAVISELGEESRAKSVELKLVKETKTKSWISLFTNYFWFFYSSSNAS